MKFIRQAISRSAARRLFLALGVAGLCLRALIPAGYMPGNLLAGELMVLCPVGVPAAIAEQLHSGHIDHDQPVIDVDRSCPIGSAVQQAWLPTNIVSLTFDEPVVDVEIREDFRSLPAVLVRRYQSRAPPLA